MSFAAPEVEDPLSIVFSDQGVEARARHVQRKTGE